MGNVVKFDTAGAVPAHLSRMFNVSNDDLSSGVTMGGYPVISYKGKTWAIVRGDKREVLCNEDGDPVGSINVVILKANPAISKIYYARGFEEGSNAKPDCYSTDGKNPAADATAPQAKNCAICPHNQWGSKVSENGAKGKACSDSRRLAVAPVAGLDTPMLLRVPAGSLKDLSQYADLLNRRGAPYQGVITKIGFDREVAHQKFTFKAVAWLDEEMAAQVAETLAGEQVNYIVGTAAAAPEQIENKSANVDVDDLPPPPKKTRVAVAEDEIAEIVKPKAKPAPVADDDDEPAPAPKKSKVAAILDETNTTLDDILKSLDD